MARPLRITFSGAFYHITARGNERKQVFKSRRDREKFLNYLSSATERYHARIHAYCLMDNHYHLLMETPQGNLPQIMRHINGAYTTYFNIKRNRAGHLFQGRYKAILVEKDEYAKELSRYLHLNPVRAKMVESPADYQWSSYCYYTGKKKAPQWLYRDFILDYFGKRTNSAQKRYRDFVLGLIGKTYQSPLRDVISATLLGSEAFIADIKDRFLAKMPEDKELPALKQLSPKASMAGIIALVEKAMPQETLLSRNVKIFLIQKHTPLQLLDIGKHFGIGASGVSQARRRLCIQMQKDRKLRKRVEKIVKEMKP